MFFAFCEERGFKFGPKSKVFCKSQYAVESYTKKHLVFVICQGSILVEFLDKCMSELVVRQRETVVKPHGVEVETACFAGKETE